MSSPTVPTTTSSEPPADRVARVIAEHIDPFGVVRTITPDLCPYCLAVPSADPCAVHR